MDRRSKPPCPKKECHFILGIMAWARPHMEFVPPVANNKATFTREKEKLSPQVGN